MNKQNTILIPAEAVEASHIQPGEHIAIHVAENTLVVVPEKLTALQAVNAIALLGDVGSDLVAIVKDACGTCAERREQGLCPFVDTSSISFAPPQAAGLTHCAVPPFPTRQAARGPRETRQTCAAHKIFHRMFPSGVSRRELPFPTENGL